jgi:hypothetical protein
MLTFRSTTNSKDQAPRQAFLAGAVLPTERTVVMGIVNAVKILSQSRTSRHWRVGSEEQIQGRIRDCGWPQDCVQYLDASHASRISHTGRAG